jgi:hypothetical protein
MITKITLKLGEKEIELTANEFEELKRDMRELDKQYPYWHVQAPIPITYASNILHIA